ncbi:MAG: ABC transporter ATP-binding protein [Nitrososphaerales archaeon]
MAVKIQIKGISVAYGSIRALDNVTISLGEGCITSLIGPNGAGKTTLLKCIDRIVKPKIGTVLLNGYDINELSSMKLARLISYVPQRHTVHFPLTALEVTLMGRRPYVSWSLGKRDPDIAWKALETVGAKHLAHRYIDELSGGERQKIIIARALAQEPEVLLLDEPTANLDIRHQFEVLNLIRQLARERNLTVVMALHDLSLAYRFSDFVIMLNNGKVFAAGKLHQALTPSNIVQTYGVNVTVLEDLKTVVPLGVSS